MYKTPIEIITENAKMIADDNGYKAVTQYGFKVDRDELLKALSYDREQYNKGFREGYEARENEIVRCKDCNLHNNCIFEETFVIARMENPFCCVGKRKE